MRCHKLLFRPDFTIKVKGGGQDVKAAIPNNIVLSYNS